MRDGKGIMQFDDGSKYSGFWKEDQFCGKGINIFNIHNKILNFKNLKFKNLNQGCTHLKMVISKKAYIKITFYKKEKLLK